MTRRELLQLTIAALLFYIAYRWPWIGYGLLIALLVGVLWLRGRQLERARTELHRRMNRTP